MSLIAAMAGHADAGAFSYFGSMGLNEGRAALKVALLRFLGSAKPVSGAGFKAAAEYINAAQKGAKLVSTASENVFKPAMKLVLPTGEPSEKALELLDRKVADNDPESNNKLMAAATNGHVGHYMPEHQVALTASSVAALQYLRTLKPQPQTNAPLDRPIAPTAQQEARYQRALIIAQQPAMVMQHIKDGTLQPSDVQDLDAMYPAMRQAMSQKLTNDMIAAKEQGTEVPYHTRVSLSMFLGQPLDSTMNPQAIIAAQPAPKPMPQPQNQPMKGRKGKTAIDKMPNNYKTANQTAESDRSSRD